VMRLSNIAARAALAVALIAATAIPASAQQDEVPSSGVFKTAREIFALCTSQDVEEVEACDWFIMGAHDMIKLYGDTELGGDRICIPMGTEQQKIRDTVLAYWRADSSSLRFSAASTIYNALVAAYPCSS
jgi:hypothetical protein